MNFVQKIYRLLPFLFWVAIIFGFNSPWVGILTLIAAGIHELGHCFALMIMKKAYKAPRGVVSGLRIHTGLLSYKEDFIVYLSGPLANFICWAVCRCLPFAVGEYTVTFSLLNLMTGMSNLLVVRGYDGYGIVSSLFNIRASEGCGYEILRWCSILSLGFSVVFSLYLCYCCGEGLWIYCIFIYSLFCELEEVRRAFFENSGEKQRKNEKIKDIK